MPQLCLTLPFSSLPPLALCFFGRPFPGSVLEKRNLHRREVVGEGLQYLPGPREMADLSRAKEGRSRPWGCGVALRANGQGSNKQTETQTGGPKSGPHPKTSHSGRVFNILAHGICGACRISQSPRDQRMISSTTSLQVTTGEPEAQRRA